MMYLTKVILQICCAPNSSRNIVERYFQLIFLALVSQSCANILRLKCATIANFTVQETNRKLERAFLTFHGVDKPQCQYECSLNKRCKTINIHEDEWICELNEKSTEDGKDNVTTVAATGWTYYSTCYNETMIGHNCVEWRPCKDGFICHDSCNCPGYHCVAARSCLGLFSGGIRKNGLYNILDDNDAAFPVYCDFESEAKSVWTLIMSYSLQNKEFFTSPFFTSTPRSEGNPDWVDYRLGLPRMRNIASSSTMWRATCSFPTYKADIYRDYMRARLSNVDILNYNGIDADRCRKVDQINVRGHAGFNITVPFWQGAREPFHIDTRVQFCEFDAFEGSVGDEDNFGNYMYFNRAFRCTERDESTTQYWFGVDV